MKKCIYLVLIMTIAIVLVGCGKKSAGNEVVIYSPHGGDERGEYLAKKAKEENGGGDEDTGGEDEMGGEDTGGESGAEEEGGDAGNIDDEMMGDVQPESTETTQV